MLPEGRRFLLLCVAGFAIALSACGQPPSQPSARALEARLLAPCCYGGTLDVHDSELARDLRREIADRIARGEATERIQSDFVARYGDQVVAARSSRPIEAMSFTAAGAMLVGAVALAIVLRQWTRKVSLVPAGDALTATPRDALDARLDAELAEIDDG